MARAYKKGEIVVINIGERTVVGEVTKATKFDKVWKYTVDGEDGKIYMHVITNSDSYTTARILSGPTKIVQKKFAKDAELAAEEAEATEEVEEVSEE